MKSGEVMAKIEGKGRKADQKMKPFLVYDYLLRESDKDTISGLAFLYFDTWFRNDNYYQTYQFTYNIVGDTAVISVVIISGS